MDVYRKCFAALCAPGFTRLKRLTMYAERLATIMKKRIKRQMNHMTHQQFMSVAKRGNLGTGHGRVYFCQNNFGKPRSTICVFCDPRPHSWITSIASLFLVNSRIAFVINYAYMGEFSPRRYGQTIRAVLHTTFEFISLIGGGTK